MFTRFEGGVFQNYRLLCFHAGFRLVACWRDFERGIRSVSADLLDFPPLLEVPMFKPEVAVRSLIGRTG
jgi:hypothetical protein